jgi:hypothetical protein
MARKERLRRQDPHRTGPIRRFSTMFRPEGAQTSGSGGQSAPIQDEIGDAVRMGYSVIEEQIRQGQRAAEKLGGAASGFGSATNTVTDVANRLMRYTTDLAALHFDLMAIVLQPNDTNGGPGSVAAAASGSARVTIEIESSRKNQVTLDLWQQSQNAKLTVPALHSAEADKPPITDIRFVAATEQTPAHLGIKIANTQPGGVYSGLILDSSSGQAGGTLSLKLDDE